MQRSPMDGVLRTVQATLREHRMVEPGARVLVALSGGPDSVALLVLLAALRARFGIALGAGHVNHQLRGAEADEDQATAEGVATAFGIPCWTERIRVAPGGNLEARSRIARYAALERIAAREGFDRIATGHTLDDQAETVLLRLVRGSGLDGVAGIQPVRGGRVIRPVLDCRRADLRRVLDRFGIPYRSDGSNTDRRFARNRLRLDVLPVLERLNPRVAAALGTLAGIAGPESSWLDAHVAMKIAAASREDGALAIAGLMALPSALRPRGVRVWLRRRRGSLLRVHAVHVRTVLDLARSVAAEGGRVRLPGGEVVLRDGAFLVWAERDGGEGETVRDGPVCLAPGEVVCLAGGWSVRAEQPRAAPVPSPADLWSCVLDAEVVGGGVVCVRPARPGDRVAPLGMRGHRKLQDVFTDRKVPRQGRAGYPVVEAAGEIVWVPGLVRGRHALVTPQTRVVVRLVVDGTGVAGP